MAAPHPLTEYADKILTDGWCLRSALVRYAQAEPMRSTICHALMRRFDAALHTALASADDADRTGRISELGPSIQLFDELADGVVAWASNRTTHTIPNELVDRVCASVIEEYARCNVPEEAIDPAEWKGMRSSEGRRAPRAKTADSASPKTSSPRA